MQRTGVLASGGRKLKNPIWTITLGYEAQSPPVDPPAIVCLKHPTPGKTRSSDVA
jgi:hypothetical protein